jgi:hypothetical protein
MPATELSGYGDGDEAPLGWKLIVPGIVGDGCALGSAPQIADIAGVGEGLTTKMSTLETDGAAGPYQMVTMAHTAAMSATPAQ